MWEYLRDSFNNFRFVPRAIASLNILMLKTALIRNKISKITKITIVKIQLDQKIKCTSNKKQGRPFKKKVRIHKEFTFTFEKNPSEVSF